MIALLFNVRSLYNVGSIFRTADGAGFEKLYLCGITPTPIDRFKEKRKELSKVALGAEDYIAWEKIGSSPSASSTISLIKKLKKEKYKIIAIEQNKKSISYKKLIQFGNNRRLALIVGDEVNGIPNSILKECDYIAEIPMLGKKESLNVSVAFGIIAYQLVKTEKLKSAMDKAY